MASTRSLAEKLEFLTARTGEPDGVVLSRAIEAGLDGLYFQAVSDAYLEGQIPRELALQELGPEAVADLDYARSAVEADVRWGLMVA